ncbi:MAG: HAD family phosphatase [Proteobacteria bacterium]|nr:HAD family phosphatase [Pseudomonadota bacterium]MBU4385246.1 HAD family phosphatase [Pseudomonadota bacterium]MBU4605712.1 HAD family phosphatase [Pseudomonadota bacterium]MCG2764854.1 HAD family phosphatase [Desulfarculaceae bacterium]
MPETSARGLFLDLDGTLADSMRVMTEATDRFLKDLGLERMGGGPHRWAGRTPYDIMGALKEHNHLEASVEDLVEHYYKLVDQAYTDQATVMPGGRRLLAAAAQRGVFTAVVTSTLRSVAEGFLAHQGLREMVNAVVTVEDIHRGKPDPEPYLLALNLSGLSAGEVLAVEDAPMGAMSATGAGLTTWIMAPRGNENFPEIAGVAGFIKSLDQLIPRLGS